MIYEKILNPFINQDAGLEDAGEAEDTGIEEEKTESVEGAEEGVGGETGVETGEETEGEAEEETEKTEDDEI